MKRDNYALFHKDVLHNSQGDPYIVRWRLIQTPLFAIYLHHVLRSDEDRDLHDHPWPFVSFILRGGYWEWAPDRSAYWESDPPVRLWRRPFSFVRHRANDLHRLELPEGRTAWTLVFCGRRGREWGFQTDEGWVPWKEYLARKGMTS